MDWDNQYSLHNMIEQLDMTCYTRAQIGTFGGVFFAGWAMMSLVIPPLSDRYGRRKITIMCMLLQIPVILGFLLSTSYYFTLMCNLSLGCLSGGRVMV